jgi:RNase H-like domain found in reverse transcriptase
LGAVLQQLQGDRLAVIAYASRILFATERNYSITKRETFAIVFAFRAFRQFILVCHFQLRVDHSPLTYLRSTPEVMGQPARWLDFIEEFDYSREHRSGHLHGNCTTLSLKPPEVEENSQLQTAANIGSKEKTA